MNTRNLFLALAATLAGLATIPAQAGAFDDNPDLYGHVLVSPPKATSDAHIEAGRGDSYGSVLLDPDSRATTEAMIERGQGDIYGSVLLDIRWAGNRGGQRAHL